MPAVFVKPDVAAIQQNCQRLCSLLKCYEGETIASDSELSNAAYWLGFYSVATRGKKQRHRMIVPLNRVWLAMKCCSREGYLCWLPSRWPLLIETGSYAATPKLARDWAAILQRYTKALFWVVDSGEYARIVTSNEMPVAEHLVTEAIEQCVSER